MLTHLLIANHAHQSQAVLCAVLRLNAFLAQSDIIYQLTIASLAVQPLIIVSLAKIQLLVYPANQDTPSIRIASVMP
jgi:hypothetical protein